MSFLVSKQPVFNAQGATDAYELAYCFASYDGDENNITKEDIADAKEYLKLKFDLIFDRDFLMKISMNFSLRTGLLLK